MNLPKTKLKFKSSERGVGLILLLIAAAILVSLAAVVATFISNQNRASAVIAKSADCSEIANSISDYLKKDESSLFVNSIGIDADGTFSDYANALTNVDGNSRFGFMQNTPAVSMSAPSVNVANESTLIQRALLPAGTALNLYNYLNTDTSFSRLLSLTNAASVCGTEGTVFENNDTGTTTTLIDGITIERPNVRVLMSVNILEGGTSLCNSGQLTRLPSLYRGVGLTYTIKVLVNSNTEQPSTCTASGTVGLGSDTATPLTVMHISSIIDNDNRCDTVAGNNTQYCIAGARRQTADIVADVYTATDTSDCRTCLDSINHRRYNSCNQGAGFFDLINPNIINLCATSCTENDPGSVFFCKLTHREQTPVSTAWWPCNQKPSSVPGSVTIAYQDTSGSLDTTRRTTRATIRVSNLASALPPARDWLLDVRAVDTAGQVFGASALSTATNFAYVPPGFRDCSCDGSCVWQNGVMSACPAGPAPACPIGTPNGTPLPRNPQQNQTHTPYCAHPENLATQIDSTNCIAAANPGTTGPVCPDLPCVGSVPAACVDNGTVPYGPCIGTPPKQSRTLPCISGGVSVPVANCPGGCFQQIDCGAPPPPNYACDFTGIPMGACTGTPPKESRTGVCMDTAVSPSVSVAVSNCTDSCFEENDCGTTPTYSCEAFTDWSDCTPTCTQSCEETRSGTCKDQDGNTTAGMCGTSNCEESRTDYAEGCTYSCDTSTAVASTCSAGPCNQAGEITYTGAVCKDSDGAVVDISNCGGNCNPSPTSCDRGCTTSCVAVAPATWTPASCPGAPTDCNTQTMQFRPTTCKYSDGTACSASCSDESQQCAQACSDCAGGVAHGGYTETPIYASATNSCEQRTCTSTPFRQDCNNGVLTPASLPGGAITSCTENPITDGTWQCSGSLVMSGACGDTTPYFATCESEVPDCKQSNGQPATCCAGSPPNCGVCRRFPTDPC